MDRDTYRFPILTSLFLGILLLAGCGGGGGTQVSVSPSITSAATATFTVGTAGSFTVTVSGTPAPALSETGTLPSGVAFDASTHILSGTPAAGTGRAYHLTFTASNGVGVSAVQNFTLNVNQPPALTSAANTSFTVGTATSFTVTTTGFPAPAVTESGALPSGIAFADQGNGTAALSGTAATGSGGTYPITFTASNGVGTDATQSFTLTIYQGLAITSASSTTFTVGTAGSFTVTATGSPAPTLSETGALPGGITFDAATGILSGTPATDAGGTYPITFTASNGVLVDATQSFTLTVDNTLPVLNSIAPTSVNAGSPDTTIALSGSAFVPTSVAQANGSNLATTYLSATSLSATLPASLLASAGTVSVTVFSPGPGGGTSAGQAFQVLANVAVTPSSAAPLTGGTTTQFSASVSGTSNQSVTWSLASGGTNLGSGNSSVGTISSTGLYTSPADVPYPAQISVIASSTVSAGAAGTSAVTVTSPAEDWPKYHRDLANTGRSTETAINSQTAPHLQMKWSFTTGGPISASPAVATVNVGGTPTLMLYVGSWDGVFHALNAVTGTEVWSFTIDAVPNTGACLNSTDNCSRIASSPAVANGDVYFGAANGYVYCLNASTGALVWKYQLGDPTLGYEVWASPAVYTATIGGVSKSVVAVAVASHDDTPCVPGQVELFDALNGGVPLNVFNILQGCPSGQVCNGGGVWSSPAIDTSFGSPVLYIGTGNPGNGCSPPSTGTPTTAYTDGIVALNGNNLSLLSFYQAYTADPSDRYDFGSSVVLHSTAQCGGTGTTTWATEANKWGTVFTLPRGSSGFTSSTALQCTVNPDASGTYSGETIATPAILPGSSASDCNNLFLPSEYGYLWNLQQDSTGKLSSLSTSPWPLGVNITGGCVPPSPGGTGPCPLFSAPASEADVLIFGGGDGNVYIDTDSGTQVFAFGTSGLVPSGPALSHGRVYFGSYDHKIYCLSVDGK